MERYDGKTKKDDYIKYALIAAGIVALIVLYKLVTWGIQKASHPTPDMTVVIACEAAVDFDAEDTLEANLSTCVPDIDGNGKSVVDVLPLHLVGNEEIAYYELDKVGAQTDIDLLDEYLTEGTYSLFLLSNRTEGHPFFDNYVGMQSASYQYCNQSYCRALPEDLASEDSAYCVALTGCKLFEDIGWENVPFYGCIPQAATQEEYDFAVALLRRILAS